MTAPRTDLSDLSSSLCYSRTMKTLGSIKMIDASFILRSCPLN
jgi:hypothetical protein